MKHSLSSPWHLRTTIWIVFCSILSIIFANDTVGQLSAWHFALLFTSPILGYFYYRNRAFWFQGKRKKLFWQIPAIAGLGMIFGGFLVPGQAIWFFLFALEAGIVTVVVNIAESVKHPSIPQNRASWITDKIKEAMDGKYCCNQISLKAFKELMGFYPEYPNFLKLKNDEAPGQPFEPRNVYDFLPDHFKARYFKPEGLDENKLLGKTGPYLHNPSIVKFRKIALSLFWIGLLLFVNVPLGQALSVFWPGVSDDLGVGVGLGFYTAVASIFFWIRSESVARFTFNENNRGAFSSGKWEVMEKLLARCEEWENIDVSSKPALIRSVHGDGPPSGDGENFTSPDGSISVRGLNFPVDDEDPPEQGQSDRPPERKQGDIKRGGDI